jgi:serine/threonine protein kinase
VDRFGNYVLERELGRGGMGAVYAARHAILGHHVAVKILHAELSQREDVVQRFFNEARAAAAIAHPGIVRVHDVGTAMAGDFEAAFLVMDLLAGESLAQRLKRAGTMAVAEAIDVARQIAVALAAAHAAGIVHRDLKPDNIFLVAEPEGARVVLLDFGVAKLTGALASGSDLKTKTGALLGTPHYMSPEQCDGERDVDFRSDLYSLGCMLFVMIGGKLPFEGGVGAVIGAHLHLPAPRLRVIAAHVPQEIEAIVSRLMEKDPAARFASAIDLVDALDAWTPTASQRFATPLPGKKFDVGHAETLPIPPSDHDLTLDSVVPPPSGKDNLHVRARPSIKPADEEAPPTIKEDKRPDHVPPPPSSRRAVLILGAAFLVVGAGVLAFALTRRQGEGAPIDAAVVAIVEDAPPADEAVGEAIIDAQIAATHEPDASIARTVPRDAGPRDAGVRRDAATARDAAVDAGKIDLLPKPKGPPTIEQRFARIASAETDFEASRDFMLLELHAPGDPRLARAKIDAKKAIQAHARNEERKAIHLALVDHDWAGGLAKCVPSGDIPRVDIVVQCTVFACVLDDPHLERWAGGVGYRPMLEDIAAFCERFRKP